MKNQSTDKKKKHRKTKKTNLAKRNQLDSNPKIIPILNKELEAKLAICLTFSLYFIYVIWGVWSNGTWDDDCHARYFNTLDAFNKPNHFVSLWNRPLFMVFFSIPVQLFGKYAISLFMPVISALGAYWLYLSAKELKLNYSFLVIPFLLLQPYFFGVGRDAMTEPMAATILCGGLLFSLKERWVVFALLGGLLPLARTELVLFLPLWALILLFNKQWKLIPLLGLGVLFWNLAGWLILGDPLYIISQTLGGSPETNRYGQQPFNTYFSRYFYVIGPTVFFFFFHGIIDRIRHKDFNLLILTQFLVGFGLYTLFAWKITLGQSAGFLRNLIPLSPMVAMLALYGFNFWLKSILTKKDKWLLLGSTLLISGVIAFYYRYQIQMHHILTKNIDYLNLAIAISLLLLTVMGLFLVSKRNWKKVQLFSIAFIGFLMLSHTLYTEPPHANMNSERFMMDRLTNFYKARNLINQPMTFCSHSWFHWVGDYNRNDEKFSPMKQEAISNAPAGSVVIWENHFSNRLGADVELSFLTGNNEYIQLAQFAADDMSRTAYIFIKKEANISELDYLNQNIELVPNSAESYLQRAAYSTKTQNLELANKDLLKASEVDYENISAKLRLSNLYSQKGDYDKVIALSNEIIQADKKSITAYSYKGNGYFNKKDYTQAIKAFEEVIKLNPNQNSAYYNIGLGYLRLNNKVEACKNLEIALRLNMPQAKKLIDQYCK